MTNLKYNFSYVIGNDGVYSFSYTNENNMYVDKNNIHKLNKVSSNEHLINIFDTPIYAEKNFKKRISEESILDFTQFFKKNKNNIQYFNNDLKQKNIDNKRKINITNNSLIKKNKFRNIYNNKNNNLISNNLNRNIYFKNQEKTLFKNIIRGNIYEEDASIKINRKLNYLYVDKQYTLKNNIRNLNSSITEKLQERYKINYALNLKNDIKQQILKNRKIHLNNKSIKENLLEIKLRELKIEKNNTLKREKYKLNTQENLLLKRIDNNLYSNNNISNKEKILKRNYYNIIINNKDNNKQLSKKSKVSNSTNDENLYLHKYSNKRIIKEKDKSQLKKHSFKNISEKYNFSLNIPLRKKEKDSIIRNNFHYMTKTGKNFLIGDDKDNNYLSKTSKEFFKENKEFESQLKKYAFRNIRQDEDLGKIKKGSKRKIVINTKNNNKNELMKRSKYRDIDNIIPDRLLEKKDSKVIKLSIEKLIERSSNKKINNLDIESISTLNRGVYSRKIYDNKKEVKNLSFSLGREIKNTEKNVKQLKGLYRNNNPIKVEEEDKKLERGIIASRELIIDEHKLLHRNNKKNIQATNENDDKLLNRIKVKDIIINNKDNNKQLSKKSKVSNSTNDENLYLHKYSNKRIIKEKDKSQLKKIDKSFILEKFNEEQLELYKRLWFVKGSGEVDFKILNNVDYQYPASINIFETAPDFNYYFKYEELKEYFIQDGIYQIELYDVNYNQLALFKQNKIIKGKYNFINKIGVDLELIIEEDKLTTEQEYYRFIIKSNYSNLYYIIIRQPVEGISRVLYTVCKKFLGENRHPIPFGKDLGIKEIPVHINIMVEFINILLLVWQKMFRAFGGRLGIQAILGFIDLIYSWLSLDTSKENIYIDDYNRCFQWLRWEAEKVYNIAKEDPCLHGNEWIHFLIWEMIDYMEMHHYNIMPILEDVRNTDLWRNAGFSDPNFDIMAILNKSKGVRKKITNYDMLYSLSKRSKKGMIENGN